MRNYFYDKGLLKSHRISKPVISVGNISTGGTGKSPFTIYLTGLLREHNLKPAIISRGYKRKSGEMETVYNGSEITSSVDKCGDEPMMMTRNLQRNYRDFFIITNKNRVKASEYSIGKFNPDLVILDDAFQHRKIKRNLDIVLVDAEDFIKNKFLNTFTIPSGNLRENISNLTRADIIIQNNKFGKFDRIRKIQKYNKNIFILNYIVTGFFDVNNIEIDISGKNVIAFAGIAKPDSFFGKLDEFECNILKKITFGDHYNYNLNDITGFTKNAKKETIFITTEKDFVKICEFSDFINNFNVLFMKIELFLEAKEEFLSLVQNILKH